jgi:adenine-specific DNA-methyltransferase
MKKLTANDAETKSPDHVAENLAKLKALFPELVTEDGVNVDALKQLIGKAVTDTEEKYGLNWHGKRKARQLALTPSTGTLRPCPEDSVAWDTTRNLMIEGDNLEVLKLLQKSYAGKVKLIYIDPPYNTGKDFVYPDNFQDNISNYLQLTGQVEGGQKLSSNTEASGRYHTDWLNMMYPRLKLARNLLREDGVIFVSIDDHEVHNMRAMMNEIFGEENNLTTIVWQRRDTPANDIQGYSTYHEYAVCYAKQIDAATVGLVARTQEQIDIYKNQDNDPRGVWTRSALTRPGSSEKDSYAIKNPTGREVYPPKGTSWRVSKQTLQRFVEEKRLWWGATGDGDMPFQKRFLSEVKQGVVPTTWWDYKFAGSMRNAKNEIREIFEDPPFDYPKPSSFIRRILEVSTYAKEDDIVLDFFAGSGTTAQAVLELNAKDSGNRKFILVQLPEPTERKDFPTIAEITKERTRRVGKKIREENSMFAGDLGFRVFKLASSNIQAWEPDRERLAETLAASVDHLKTDRTESDILFELLLKLGLDLTVPIETRTIAGQQVHSIGAGTLLVCLSKSITAKEVEPLALGIAAWHKTQAPAGESTIVFRDSAFADDVAKTNLTAILQQHGLSNVRSL